jgi:hypothetical protein
MMLPDNPAAAGESAAVSGFFFGAGSSFAFCVDATVVGALAGAVADAVDGAVVGAGGGNTVFSISVISAETFSNALFNSPSRALCSAVAKSITGGFCPLPPWPSTGVLLKNAKSE